MAGKKKLTLSEFLWGGYTPGRLAAYGAVFGGLAFALTGVGLRGAGGGFPVLGSTIETLVACAAPSWYLLAITAFGKGLGDTIWSGGFPTEPASALADLCAFTITMYLARTTRLGDAKWMWLNAVIAHWTFRWLFNGLVITPVWSVVLDAPFLPQLVYRMIFDYPITQGMNSIVSAVILIALGWRLKKALS